MKKYELIPTDGRKSFYGKAVVIVEDNGTETLYSYNTPIIKRLVSVSGACKALGRVDSYNRSTHSSVLWTE